MHNVRSVAMVREAMTLPLIVRVLFVACVATLAGNASIFIFKLATTASSDSNLDRSHPRSETNLLVSENAAQNSRMGPLNNLASAAVIEGRYVESSALDAPSISTVGAELDDDLRSRPRSSVKLTQLQLTLPPQPYRPDRSTALVGILANAAGIVVLIALYLLIRRTFARQVTIDAKLKSHNRRLEETVAQRTRELSELSRHLIRAAEEEKAKLARDLHDELGASLTAMKFDMAYVAAKLKDGTPSLAERQQRAIDTLTCIFDLKQRLVQELWPTLLDHLGLAAALRAHGDAFTLRTGVSCRLDISDDLDIDRSPSIALYRVVQESLTNIAKHARASNVMVVLKSERQGLTLQVSDDGLGIAAGATNKAGSYGIVGMRERISKLGGRFAILRRSEAGGTVVEAFIPLAEGCRWAPGSNPESTFTYYPDRACRYVR